MRKRVTAVAAVGLVALGIWLGNWFQGLGPGGSDNSESQAESDPANVQVNLTSGSEVPSRSQPAVKQETAATATRPGRADDVLTVLIEGDAYQLQSGDDDSATFTPATLDEIVDQARNARGDTHGIRVRLRYRRNSQEGARADLISALQAAEIEREQIIEATGFVE